MMRLLISLLMLGSSITLLAQQTFNTTLLSNYTPPTRPFNQSADPFVDIWGYVAPDGSEYAIMGSDLGTHFINVTDPLNPVESDFEAGAFTSAGWRDFKTYGHYAYGVADVAANTLQIFDLQYLPDSVVKVYDDNTLSRSAHNIHVNKNRLYLISNTRGDGSYRPLDVICIKDPANPTLIGGIWNNENVVGNYSTSHDAFVRNDTVYLSVYFNNFGNTGLHAFDMTDPMNPDLVGSITNYPGKGINHASWMSSDGTHLMMVDEDRASPVKIMDITDMANPTTASTFATDPGSIAHNPFIKDCLAYISYYHEGVRIWDVSDPTNPSEVGFLDTDTTTGNGVYSPNFLGCWGVYPFLPSGNIIASDRKYGLFVFSYDGTAPACNSLGYDRVVEMDTSRDCIDDTTTNPTQIAVNQTNTLNIYPNPAQGFLMVNGMKNNSPIDILVSDIRGATVLEKRIIVNSNAAKIDLSGIKSGLYFININQDGNLHRRKVSIE